MSLLNRLSKKLERSFMNGARNRARAYLLGQSDRILVDAGFSRALLEKGNSAWPWRMDEGYAGYQSNRALPGNKACSELSEPVATVAGKSVDVGMTRSKEAEKEAIAELGQYTDAELADLGISRLAIADAVRKGRQGLDRKVA